jgi:hypothetical protein
MAAAAATASSVCSVYTRAGGTPSPTPCDRNTACCSKVALTTTTATTNQRQTEVGCVKSGTSSPASCFPTVATNRTLTATACTRLACSRVARKRRTTVVSLAQCSGSAGCYNKPSCSTTGATGTTITPNDGTNSTAAATHRRKQTERRRDTI